MKPTAYKCVCCSGDCCCCSVTKSCPTLHPMNCSVPGFPVLHYLPGFTQTHVHWVDDAIQPSPPLSSPPPSIRVFFSELALHIRWPKYWSSESKSRSVVSNSWRPHGLYSPWNSPGQNMEWVAYPFFEGFYSPRNQTGVSCIAGRFLVLVKSNFKKWGSSSTSETGFLVRLKIKELL